MLLCGGSVCIALLCLGLVLQQGLGLIGLAVSLLMGALPYCYLRASAANRQITGSYEGKILLAEVLNQYKLNHFNAMAALEQSIPYLAEAPVSQRLIYQLTLQLRTYQTQNELRSLLDDFAARCNTQWAQMLAANLYYAISMDYTITAGLEDLLKECSYTEKLIETSKRLNNEAFVMIQLLCPATYAVLIWSLMVHFEFTLGQIIQYQLFTPTGVTLFVLMIFGTSAGLISARILARPKFDI